MLLIHLLQGGQEGLILRLQTFCREQVIDKLFDHKEESGGQETEIREQRAEARNQRPEFEV
jgi:hypothetical protein